jgi:hypothetical protein
MYVCGTFEVLELDRARIVIFAIEGRLREFGRSSLQEMLRDGRFLILIKRGSCFSRYKWNRTHTIV